MSRNFEFHETGVNKSYRSSFSLFPSALSLTHTHTHTHTHTVRFGPYFVEPVIAGLDTKTGEPYIATMDLIGCPMETKDFVVGGTCTEQLYGMCESLWRPDLVRA